MVSWLVKYDPDSNDTSTNELETTLVMLLLVSSGIFVGARTQVEPMYLFVTGSSQSRHGGRHAISWWIKDFCSSS